MFNARDSGPKKKITHFELTFERNLVSRSSFIIDTSTHVGNLLKLLTGCIKLTTTSRLFTLTLPCRRPTPYRHQSTNLQSKSMDWFLCDRDLRHERINSYCFCGPNFIHVNTCNIYPILTYCNKTLNLWRHFLLTLLRRRSKRHFNWLLSIRWLHKCQT